MVMSMHGLLSPMITYLKKRSLPGLRTEQAILAFQHESNSSNIAYKFLFHYYHGGLPDNAASAVL